MTFASLERIKKDFSWLVNSDRFEWLENFRKRGNQVSRQNVCRSNETNLEVLIEIILIWSPRSLPKETIKILYHGNIPKRHYSYKRLNFFANANFDCRIFIQHDYLDMCLFFNELDFFPPFDCIDFAEACKNNGEVLKYFLENPNRLFIEHNFFNDALLVGNVEALDKMYSQISEKNHFKLSLSNAIQSKNPECVRWVCNKNYIISSPLNVDGIDGIEILDVLIENSDKLSSCFPELILSFLKNNELYLLEHLAYKVPIGRYWTEDMEKYIKTLKIAQWAFSLGLLHDFNIYKADNIIDCKIFEFAIDNGIKMDSEDLRMIIETFDNLNLIDKAITTVYIRRENGQDEEDEKNYEILKEAVLCGDIELLDLLFAHNLIPQTSKALNIACKDGDIETVRWFLAHNFERNNSCYCSAIENPQILDLLYNECFEFNGNELLELCKSGNVDSADFFIAIKMEFSKEYLFECVKYQNIQLLEYLLDLSENNVNDGFQLTDEMLNYAKKLNNPDLVKFIDDRIKMHNK